MPLTQEQIKQRRNYLGGTDCAAVLGLSRWKTALEVWAEKTGAIEPDDISGNLAIEVGAELEDLVCRLFTKRSGKEVRRVNETIFHPNYPFIAANIDRRVVGEDSIMEAKTASAWKAKEWQGEDVPQEYILQCLHQLAVTGKDTAYIAVLIGGNQDFIWKRIARDPKLIAEITRKETAFWTKFVRPKVMPQAFTRNDSDILYKLFPSARPASEIALGDEANRVIDSIKAMQADSIVLEGAIEKEKNFLRGMLQDNEAGYTDKYRVTWSDQTTVRFDSKKLRDEKPDLYEQFTCSSATRVLRIKTLATKEGKEAA